jgi:ATP-dependent DNA helicase DinG
MLVGDASTWLGMDGVLARELPGYEPRPAQLEMARAVERALARDSTLLVEAGTGTGKTLAYLVPALASGKRVVIATGTKTLQDQIVQRDLPLLQRHWPEPIAAACMKGLSNYLCLRRYEEFRRSPGALMGEAVRQLPLIERFRETSLTGDRAELGRCRTRRRSGWRCRAARTRASARAASTSMPAS